MNKLEHLHHRAMETADLAEQARHSGNEDNARNLFEQALKLETDAARLVASDLEPTRSILFRSAASLALDCGHYADADALIREARLGHPSPGIIQDLAEIEIEIQRHLTVDGIREASLRNPLH
jgi:Flp pilus assembly protein TadD